MQALRKLDPRDMVRNPVMFVVEIGALFTTLMWIVGETGQPGWFAFTVAVWLWLTVIFGNLAEAIAEGRGKAQADALRAMRKETTARLRDGSEKPAAELQRGDVVVVEAGDLIPGDGTVIEGIASVDESAITGESAPGHPRVRRRPQRGHRRHARAVRPDRGRDHPGARAVVPRPHDRPGRGRRPAARPRTRSRCRSCSRG